MSLQSSPPPPPPPPPRPPSKPKQHGGPGRMSDRALIRLITALPVVLSAVLAIAVATSWPRPEPEHQRFCFRWNADGITQIACQAPGGGQ